MPDPLQDERIMADGRPAYAWWNEIQILRQHEVELFSTEKRLIEKMAVLRIAEWAIQRDPTRDELVIHVRLPLVMGNPLMEVLNNPQDYCEVSHA